MNKEQIIQILEDTLDVMQMDAGEIKQTYKVEGVNVLPFMIGYAAKGIECALEALKMKEEE